MDWRDFLAIASLVVTVGGFSVTIYQIVRTRGSVEAARQAVTSTESRVSRNLLLGLLPQLGFVERELDVAVGRDDRPMALYQLSAWKVEAAQLRGLLEDNPEVSEALLRRLQESLVLATQAKLRLNDGRTSVAASTKRVREAISVVTTETPALAARLSARGTNEEAEQ